MVASHDPQFVFIFEYFEINSEELTETKRHFRKKEFIISSTTNLRNFSSIFLSLRGLLCRP